MISKYYYALGEISIRGQFDCGRARSNYVLMKLEFELHWRQYKDLVETANMVCWEAVAEISPTTRTFEPIEEV